MIRRYARPPVISSRYGATASAIVFTAFAPIASRVSTIRCVITIGPRAVGTTRTSTSFAPPASFTRIGSFSFALRRISSFAWRIASRAECGSGTWTSWTWPIITGPDVEAWNPPFPRAIFAELLAAAITEGSSIAIGTR